MLGFQVDYRSIPSTMNGKFVQMNAIAIGLRICEITIAHITAIA
jgi:hypothetical protein